MANSANVSDPYVDWVVAPDHLRWKLMDYETENAPLGIQYLTDPDLAKCIQEAVDDYNETPPMFNPLRWWTVNNFPYRELLHEASAVAALRLTVMKEQRREMQYDDGGIQSSIYYKSPQFRALLADLDNAVQTKMLRIKRQVNTQNCYAGIS